MTIKEFCEKSELGRDTVRFYEKQGLLEPKARANGYRDYGEGDLERVSEIRLGQMMGFTLREIEVGLRAWRKGELSTERKLELMGGKLKEVRARMAQLKSMERYLCQKMEWIAAGEEGTPPQWKACNR